MLDDYFVLDIALACIYVIVRAIMITTITVGKTLTNDRYKCTFPCSHVT